MRLIDTDDLKRINKIPTIDGRIIGYLVCFTGIYDKEFSIERCFLSKKKAKEYILSLPYVHDFEDEGIYPFDIYKIEKIDILY